MWLGALTKKLDIGSKEAKALVPFQFLCEGYVFLWSKMLSRKVFSSYLQAVHHYLSWVEVCTTRAL